MEPRRLGPFELTRQLGVGGMGVVYLAHHVRSDRPVAIKVLSPELKDRQLVHRFQQTSELLKRMNHPNIVTYYGSGRSEGQPYRAMEYMNGGSLRDRVLTHGQLTWQQTVKAGRQIANALEHCHTAGVLHLNLKLAALLISKKGRLKLGGFGLAKNTQVAETPIVRTRMRASSYLAPEQIQRGHEISGKTDLYGLGILLYELLVAEPLFPTTDHSPMNMLMQHLHDAPIRVRDRVPECPADLDELINRLLSKNPDDRPPNAGAVHAQLGKILGR